jgi:hypothetical protein
VIQKNKTLSKTQNQIIEQQIRFKLVTRFISACNFRECGLEV